MFTRSDPQCSLLLTRSSITITNPRGNGHMAHTRHTAYRTKCTLYAPLPFHIQSGPCCGQGPSHSCPQMHSQPIRRNPLGRKQQTPPSLEAPGFKVVTTRTEALSLQDNGESGKQWEQIECLNNLCSYNQFVIYAIYVITVR